MARTEALMPIAPPLLYFLPHASSIAFFLSRIPSPSVAMFARGQAFSIATTHTTFATTRTRAGAMTFRASRRSVNGTSTALPKTWRRWLTRTLWTPSARSEWSGVEWSGVAWCEQRQVSLLHHSQTPSTAMTSMTTGPTGQNTTQPICSVCAQSSG